MNGGRVEESFRQPDGPTERPAQRVVDPRVVARHGPAVGECDGDRWDRATRRTRRGGGGGETQQRSPHTWALGACELPRLGVEDREPPVSRKAIRRNQRALEVLPEHGLHGIAPDPGDPADLHHTATVLRRVNYATAGRTSVW
jgi:hypothetical protein